MPSTTRPLFAFVLACASLVTGAATAQVERVERGNLVTEGIPEIPAELAERQQQYWSARSASLADWLPGGQGIAITTRFGETSQMHVVEHPGGARKQLTFFPEPVASVAVSPAPAHHRLIFSRDVGGSEFYQIFHYDLASAEYRMLTDGQSRNGAALWSNRGDRFVYHSTQRNGRDFDLYVHDVHSGESELVLQQGGMWSATDWAPSDAALIVSKYVSINESHLHILDLQSGELTPLRQSAEKTAYGPALFHADGTRVFVVSDAGSEFRRLQLLDPQSGTSRVLTADIDWDVEELELTDDRGTLAFTVNEDGYSRLYLLSATGGEPSSPKLLDQVPLGIIDSLRFHPDGKRLAFVLNTPTSPGDVYEIDTATQELVRWTESETGGLNSQDFVEPELIRYPTFDNVDGSPRQIPAFYYKPNSPGPHPVLLDIHGGPESQERPAFNPLIQYLVNEMGIAVLAPNVRGSRGYGKSYLLLDNGFNREDSVRDIGKLLDWITRQPELDPQRVAVTGGSYGGYMTLASLTHFNDRLRCGVEAVGISNFVTFLENTQSYRRDLRRAEYGDERDPEMRDFLTRISPTTNAEKITRPLFVAQGLNDPRVPVGESQQIVETIRKNGGDVWYMLAKDEGHGFRKKSNRDYWLAATAMFLQRHLLDDRSR